MLAKYVCSGHIWVVSGIFISFISRDLRSYQDTIATFALPSLSERFEFIRQLGNVFLVRPEILKSYITENYLGRIEPALLRPYLMQRSDWSQFERAFDFVADPSDALGGTPTPGIGGIEGVGSGTGSIRSLGGVGNLKDRFAVTSVSNRLSTMMRDLENIRIGGHNSTADSGASSANVPHTVSEVGRLGVHPLSFASSNR
jgi:exocyst complex component 5